MSQPAPTSCIQVPTLEISVAVQSSAKARWEKGTQEEVGGPASIPVALGTACVLASPAFLIAHTAKQEQPSAPQKDLRSRAGIGLAQAIRWSWPWIPQALAQPSWQLRACWTDGRSEEHTSELQSLMRISYAVFCLKKQKK